MKKCKKCGVEKALEEFYEHKEMLDKHLNFCKVCVRERIHEHRQRNVDRIREYDRTRHQAKNLKPEQIRSRREYLREWRKADKRREKAYDAVRRKLKRPDRCAVCGKICKVEGHHPNYDEPLKVIWCCSVCHYILDMEKKRGSNAYNDA